jgi:outer membrane receptor protein involved in Fe transport
MNKRYFLCIALFSLNPQLANAACTPSVSQMLDEPMEALVETPISVASNVSLDPHKQPASVTVISREQLQLSAARTLNEALMTYVPGYFVAEGKSDTVGAFRGLAADSNAKIMMLINGHNINAERYGGMPDGIINGSNFDWIERIEVVRGPGSVTLGQGALQGVINIVTRSADSQAPECHDTTLSLLSGGGLNNAWQGGMEAAFNHEDYNGYIFVQQKNYEGQGLRRQGYSQHLLYADSLPGAGNGVVADVGHRLKRSDNLSIFGHFGYGNLSLDVLHVNQMRDLYFFSRDSDGIGEELTYVGLNHDLEISPAIRLESKLDATIDDNSQYTVQTGSTAGGNRELRYGVKEILHFDHLWQNNQLALGSEARFYEIGLNNANGENFIINNFSFLTGETTASLNKKYAFVFPANINIFGFFIEDHYQMNSWLSVFGGLRLDKHDYWDENLSSRAGVFITPWQDGQFRFSYQEGFRGPVGSAYGGGYIGDGFLRIPNLSKLSSANIPGYSDTTVKPESLETLELAFNQRLNQHWQFENVLFYSKASKTIDVDAICGDCLKMTLPPIGNDIPGYNWYWFYVNKAGSSEQIGFETSVRYAAEPFNIAASHSLVDPLSYTGSTTRQVQMPAIAQNVTRFNVIYKPWKQVSFGANYLFYDSWNDTLGRPTQGAHLLNTSVIYTPYKSLELTLSVKNILGENNLYPILNYVSNDVAPGAPAIESTTFWLSTRINLF